MRFLPLLALVPLALAAPALPAAATRDWSATVTRTASGSFVVGNPAARVKLVEYASYTCPHCAAFARESQGVLIGQMVRSGSTSLEVRNLVHDRLDLAAVLLARCAGPRRFLPLHEALYATQDRWLQRGIMWEQVNGQRVGLYPAMAQLKASAEGAGLVELARAQGLSAAETDACLADQAAADRVTGIAIPAGVDGTPTFFVNGTLHTRITWTGLQPVLRAAGAH